MDKKTLHSLPNLCVRVIKPVWQSIHLHSDFYFDVDDDSLYAVVRGSDVSLHFPPSGGHVSLVNLTSGETKLIGQLRHNFPSMGLVNFEPEAPFDFSWVGEVNNRNPIELNPYMQAEVDFSISLFEARCLAWSLD